MKNTKQQAYLALIEKFKEHKFSDPELLNPHTIPEIGFNYSVLNPWELWHNNLDAKVLLIGQDWGDLDYFQKNFINHWEKEKNSPTNQNLKKLFSCIGYEIGLPEPTIRLNSLPLFFTNAILGIKNSPDKKDMSKQPKDTWWKESAQYLKDLIEIIQPTFIIAMSNVAYKTICQIYSLKPENFLNKAIENNGKINLPNGSKLFVVSHCSAKGRIKRRLEIQLNDWTNIENLMKNYSSLSTKNSS